MKTAGKSPAADRRLTHVTTIALALPDTTRLVHGSHAQFLVRKKTFAYFLNNHHGDGIVALAYKVLPGDNRRLINAGATRQVLPSCIHGLQRLGRTSTRQGGIDWDEVEQLLSSSYVLIAPKKLAKAVQERGV